MPKIYKLLKLLDFNTFLFEKKKTSGERVKENVAYTKWNNHFLHNIFYGVRNILPPPCLDSNKS